MSECCMSNQDNALVIVQGTTPILTLNLDCDLSQDYEVRLAVKTSLNKTFVLTNDNLTITKTDTGCSIVCQFTQEQTLAMKRNITIQLRAKNIGTQRVLGTLEHEIQVVNIIDEEVM
jgi:hypothetical protein